MNPLPSRKRRAAAALLRAGLAGLVLWAAAGLAPAARAGQEYLVGCGADRLQQLANAVASANANPGPDTLLLAADCLYVFSEPSESDKSSAVPIITDDLTVQGQGATLMRASEAPAKFRLITVGPQVQATLLDLTVRGGDAGSGFGGGVTSGVNSSLTLNNVAVLSNKASSGGGVGAQGELTLLNSRIGLNTANSGGGVFAQQGVTAVDTDFTLNWAAAGGGLLFHGLGLPTGVTMTNNTSEGEGGALRMENGQLHLNESRLAYNAAEKGGGAFLLAGRAWLTSTEIVSNTAKVVGGLVTLTDVDVTATNVSISYNQSDSAGAGLLIGGELMLEGAIVVDNQGTGVSVSRASVVSNSYFFGNGSDGLRANSWLTVTQSAFVQNGKVGAQGRFVTVRYSQFSDNEYEGLHGLESAVVEDSSFTGNGGKECGGARLHGAAYVARSWFENNDGGSFGGGLCVFGDRASSVVVNSVFLNNEAERAAAIFALLDENAGPDGPMPSLTLLNNTVVHTGTPASAIGAANEKITITNNIITGHGIGVEANTTTEVAADYNLFFEAAQPYVAATGGPHDLTTDPLFVNPAQHDFRLQAGSPARDSGLAANVTGDYLGVARPQGLAFDRGAFEFFVFNHALYLPYIGR